MRLTDVGQTDNSWSGSYPITGYSSLALVARSTTNAMTIVKASHRKNFVISTSANACYRYARAMFVGRNRIVKRSRAFTATLFESTQTAHLTNPVGPVQLRASNMWNFIAGLGILLLPVVFAVTIQRSGLAVLLSVIVLTALLHLTSYIGAGYVDPFYAISIPVSIVAFFVWSALVIWVARRVQRMRQKSARKSK